MPNSKTIEHPDDPKDDGRRVPAATYAWMIPYVTRIARRHGYAIGVHGSMGRDLDLIAIPWVEDANPPEDLLKEICDMLDGTLLPPNDETGQPHGRRAHTITFKNAWHFIDISVMERHPKDRYPFRIEVRKILSSGMFGYGPDSIFFLLCENMDQPEATKTVWHEVVHMLRRVSGSREAKEDETEEIAERLAAACPEVLELCGIADKFKNEAANPG